MSSPNQFIVLGGAAVMTIVAAFAALSISDSLDGVEELEQEPSVTLPEAPATEAAAPEPEPAPVPDLTYLWLTLGAVTTVSIAGGAGTLAVRSVRRARRSSLAMRTARDRQEAALSAIRERHQELLRKILHAETDWDTLFSYPAINDPSVPQTYEMLKAMRTANTLRDTAGEIPATAPAFVDVSTLPYAQAVDAFELAWDVADKHARRVGQSSIPRAERKLIQQVRDLLAMAENTAASTVERDLAYRRAQTLIADLTSIHVPQAARAVLEASQRLMLSGTA